MMVTTYDQQTSMLEIIREQTFELAVHIVEHIVFGFVKPGFNAVITTYSFYNLNTTFNFI